MDHQESQKKLGPFQEEVCLIFQVICFIYVLYYTHLEIFPFFIAGMIVYLCFLLYSFGNIPFLYSWFTIVYLDFLLVFPFIMINFLLISAPQTS